MANRKLLVIILVVGALARIYLVSTAAGINSDAFKYARTAERIAQRGVVGGMEGRFFWPFFPVNRQLPVYPFLASVVNCVVGDLILALRIVSMLSGIALIWVGYAVAKELFKREEIALLSAGLLAFHPEFARASAAVYREVTMALLLALALLFFLWAVEGKRSWAVWALVAGLTLFVAFMTRADGAAAAAALGLVALFIVPGIDWKRRFLICLIMALAFMVFEVPYVLWLKRQTGYWMVSQWQIQSKMSELESARSYLLSPEESPDGPVR